MGITCLIIASKYEEIYPPPMSVVLKVIQNALTKAQVLSMETGVLSTLEFEVSFPTAHHFLQRFSRLAQFTRPQQSLAVYLAATALLDAGLARELPSKLAAYCTYAVLKQTCAQTQHHFWSTLLQEETKCGKSCELDAMASELLKFVKRVEDSSFKAIHKHR